MVFQYPEIILRGLRWEGDIFVFRYKSPHDKNNKWLVRLYPPLVFCVILWRRHVAFPLKISLYSWINIPLIVDFLSLRSKCNFVRRVLCTYCASICVLILTVKMGNLNPYYNESFVFIVEQEQLRVGAHVRQLLAGQLQVVQQLRVGW
jgi:hypothetical protein